MGYRDERGTHLPERYAGPLLHVHRRSHGPVPGRDRTEYSGQHIHVQGGRCQQRGAGQHGRIREQELGNAALRGRNSGRRGGRGDLGQGVPGPPRPGGVHSLRGNGCGLGDSLFHIQSQHPYHPALHKLPSQIHFYIFFSLSILFCSLRVVTRVA